MKKNIYENFLVNKEEADIDEIQKKLNFSNKLGSETFFFIEPFYKKGDEQKLIDDYNLQSQGFNFFKTDKGNIIFEKLRFKLKTIKDLRNILKKDIEIFLETEIYDIKQFLLSVDFIKRLFPINEISIFDKNILNYIDDLLRKIDKFHPYEPTFSIYKESSSNLSILIDRLEEVEKEKKYHEKKLEEKYKYLNISYSNPKIILKEDKDKIDKIDKNDFGIIEETTLYLKIRLKPDQNLIVINEKLEKISNEIYLEKLKICKEISDSIKEKSDLLLKSFEIIGIIDSYLTKIDFAYKINGIVPEISFDSFEIENGRNLILEKYVEKENIKYIPLNIKIDRGTNILTGSNMGGKTCTLKTIAQISYLVHSGLMVPAQSVKIPLFNGIYISRTSSSSIKEGLSSFGYELISIKPFFENLEKGYLFLLDEPASGTNPLEGKAIVKAMAQKFSTSNSFAVISTHYDGISEGIKCRKYCILGFTKDNLMKISQYLATNEDLPLFKLHQFIDHSVIEVFTESEVPKNAITLLKLFKFQNDFVQDCINKITDQ